MESVKKIHIGYSSEHEMDKVIQQNYQVGNHVVVEGRDAYVFLYPYYVRPEYNSMYDESVGYLDSQGWFHFGKKQ